MSSREHTQLTNTTNVAMPIIYKYYLPIVMILVNLIAFALATVTVTVIAATSY